ncbi:glycosyltransferase family 87 protein [Patulibacter sp.]|uniref:glycosyltransferase family 87 protein n=1 Tax=Patulibacter sp. TaxID=1912859 RepID=UPI0027247CF8|nr:glycosyltransferase family 87 protein [Patulibacter sp.]MDO9410698.1 glycosyltransferase family 87 protein [Patulibacter sp.]
MRAVLLREGPARWWVLAALVLGAASLPLGHALAFDASAWVVWGREVWSLDLATGAGPSWKPFPVLFTAPFALLGDGAAGAWLVVARAGALLAVVGAARLATRAAGPWAGLVTVATLVLSPWWLLNGALGNADPILGALVVWAILLAQDGRPRTAFLLTATGALIRPEAWPFVAAHALWLIRRGDLRLGPALGAGVGVLALWVVPDLLSSGLDSTTGATGTASAGSAANTSFPFGTVLRDLGEQAPWVGLVAALAGAWAVRRGRPGAVAVAGAGGDREDGAGAGTPVPLAARPVAWLALVLAYALLVAVMAQVGFAGNPRYLVPGLVLLGAVAGTVVAVVPPDGVLRLPGLPSAVPGRAVAGVLVVLALLVTGVGDVRGQAEALDDRAALRRGLFDAVEERGGPDRIARGTRVRSGSADLRSLVAEALHESIPAALTRPRSGDLVARPAGGGRWSLTPVP